MGWAGNWGERKTTAEGEGAAKKGRVPPTPRYAPGSPRMPLQGQKLTLIRSHQLVTSEQLLGTSLVIVNKLIWSVCGWYVVGMW